MASRSSPCFITMHVRSSYILHLFQPGSNNIFYQWLNLLIMMVVVIENFSLIGLTFVSSTENYCKFPSGLCE